MPVPLHDGRLRALVVVLALVLGLGGSAALAGRAAANPFAGARLYVDPDAAAARQAAAWRDTRPADALAMETIARRPQADWFGDWSGDVRGAVDARVTQITAAGALPVLVAYDIPGRDCGSWSAGGSGSADAYRAWIRGFAAGIGDRPAVVLLEPDALALMDCLPEAAASERLALLDDAVGVLGALPHVATYLDGGHSGWQPADVAAGRLRAAGVARAAGFFLDVSNFRRTADELAYGDAVSAALGGAHFVVDTSRNGLGPAPDDAWCNPDGRALGPAPGTATGDPLADAFLDVKHPGESDGACNGGPPAGTWWPEYALGLARRTPVRDTVPVLGDVTAALGPATGPDLTTTTTTPSAARAAAHLRVTRCATAGGRLDVRGRLAPTATGAVRVALVTPGGRTALRATAYPRRGAFTVVRRLPPGVRTRGARVVVAYRGDRATRPQTAACQARLR